jgi:hypothetical protein
MSVGPRLPAILAAAALAVLVASCKRAESQPPPPELPVPPARSELPVEQTPVQSLYEEKPGVLYERPAHGTGTPSPVRSATPTPTPHYPS